MTDPRFQRTLGVLSDETLTSLSAMHIVIAGVGGPGGQAAIDLARLGVAWFTLADFDDYEISNINRQVGCFEDSLGRAKVDVVAEMCHGINPSVQVRTFPAGVSVDNAMELVTPPDGWPTPDFVIEVMDLQGLQEKVALHAQCRERGIYCLTALAVGFGAAMHVYPPEAPPYDELYYDDDGKMDFSRIVPRIGSYAIQKYVDALYDGTGHSPSCAIGVTLSSALMVSEIMRGVVDGRESMCVWPQHVYLDAYDHVYFTAQAARGDAAQPTTDRFVIKRPDPAGPYVLWGGAFPSGSLKHLTFEAYVADLDMGAIKGFIELTGGCTALALQYFAEQHGIPAAAVIDPSGAEHLRRIGFRGEIIVPTSLEEAMALCASREAEGWHWPKQMANPALIPCVELWAMRLLDELKSLESVKQIVTGFGTGATAVGLRNILAPAGYEVLALEAPEAETVFGWRHYATQNMGEQDLFAPYAGTISRDAVPAGSGPEAYPALCAYTLDRPAEEVLVIAHDALPAT